MTVTLKGTVQVDHRDLRAAFEAVRPHAAKGKAGDEILPLHRVRLIAQRENLWVLAHNGGTMAAARVRILDDTRPNPEALDDGPFVIDLPPSEVDRFVSSFKLKRQAANATELEGRIELTFETHQLTFEQGPGGLYPGATMGSPLADVAEQFPDVLGWVARAFRQVGTSTQAKVLATGSATLGLWSKAGKAYAQPVWITGSGESTSPTYVVEVGDSFLGTFGSSAQDSDSLKKRASVRRLWFDVLPSRAPLGEAPPLLDEPDDDEPDDGDTLDLPDAD